MNDEILDLTYQNGDGSLNCGSLIDLGDQR
jgi:hypothetical protein